MNKSFLLSLSLLTLTACATETAKPIKSHTERIRIIDKPIEFGAERIAMTKLYIRQHYGMIVNNIKISFKNA